MKKENSVTRRSFLKTSAVAGAVGVIGTSSAGILTSCATGGKKDAIVPLKEPGTYYIPELPDLAADGKELKAGVVGCGGRGSGAAMNFLNAANGVTIVALGDVFEDRVNGLADRLKKDKNIDIPADKRFVGLDAYKQVIDSGIDVLIDCTPPFFRAEHFKYAVEKGKHSFLEKPICVDAAGYRTLVAAAKQAQAKKLSVVTGTQRHHERKYVEGYKQVMNGLIGEITGGAVYWNQSMLWYRDRQPQWNDFEFMVRDWVNWKWLSGDHIVEQHVHNIDVFTWFSGLKPVKAVGFGSRHRRVTGDQYDNFSVDFTMENGIHLHSMCRQIDGCANNVSEFIQGTKGSWTSNGHVIKDLQGNVLWQYDSEAEKAEFKQIDPYTLEHVNLINSIRKNTPIEQASETAVSNMGAIMGRESAYTGQEVTWDAMTAAQLDYTPADMNIGKMNMSGFTVPVPGSGK
ncbi:Gfo/Idh/MocA family oxidoreductase [Proteiniphilum sp.]|uniref:Gfo/Idh/MocA family oxidoreductase n=1 Tax=Proteiniphilum sp. TaxID=1926877 RepID=UPI002B1EAA4F|nr:Gfo/Idh/MocA family oxidoreductase [Proteiniphilum sp.]MEA4918191.1 Gfo/Idh/MocA family oxidoreductase [Proteiniphilum sp.]